MTQVEAEELAEAVNATRLLRSSHKIEHVHLEEAQPANFVVVVYFSGHADPCLLGDVPGTQAWLDARRLTAEENELTGPEADRVAEELLGLCADCPAGPGHGDS